MRCGVMEGVCPRGLVSPVGWKPPLNTDELKKNIGQVFRLQPLPAVVGRPARNRHSYQRRPEAPKTDGKRGLRLALGERDERGRVLDIGHAERLAEDPAVRMLRSASHAQSIRN
jgi:hypothetical protein